MIKIVTLYDTPLVLCNLPIQTTFDHFSSTQRIFTIQFIKCSRKIKAVKFFSFIHHVNE